MRKVVILTGSETRHVFFRKFIANSMQIEVLASYCESAEKGLSNTVSNAANPKSLKVKHLLDREKSEHDFYDLFNQEVCDLSNPIFISCHVTIAMSFRMVRRCVDSALVNRIYL